MKTGQYPVSFLFALLLALAAGIALALARPPTGSWPVFLLAALFAVSAILLWRGSRCCWLVFLLLLSDCCLMIRLMNCFIIQSLWRLHLLL